MPEPKYQSIRDVLMRCVACSHECRLEDCNCDDPIGDGCIGCPISDCGGEMKGLLA